MIKIESQLRQTEQLNGYQLVSFQGSTNQLPLQLLGKTYAHPSQPTTALNLFQLPAKQHGAFQFLVNSPLSIEKLEELPQALVLQQSVESPIQLPDANKNCVIVADQTYMANAFAMAKQRQLNSKASTVIFLEGDLFPFMIKPARFWVPEMPDEAIGASALLEDWEMMNRIASTELLPGCFHGTLPELIQAWAEKIATDETWQLLSFTTPNTQQNNQQIAQNYAWLEML